MKRGGLISKITAFFREVRVEAGKVNWPGQKEVLRYTVIVIGASVAVAALLGTFDYFLVEILRRFVF